MLRSLFTGISGLTAHQQMLDVTANNIANVNTTGFKGSRAAFQDTLSQTLQGAAGARGNTAGGTNSIQIGLGVKLAGTELAMTQGGAQSTGVGTDLMINGDGFFAVQKGDNGQVLYTRSGAFHMDEMGHLVTSDGALVSGVGAGSWDADNDATTPDVWAPLAQPADATGIAPIDLSALLNGYHRTGTGTVADPYVYTPVTNADLPIPDPVPAGEEYGKYVSYTIDASGTVNAVRDDGGVMALGQITMATFANPNGLQKVGNTQFTQTAGSGDPILGSADDGTHGSVSAGYLEMSNVDLSAELTNLIIAQRGFQANSKSVTTADQILQTLVTLKQ
jgi:flagellar hook protein FlgE